GLEDTHRPTACRAQTALDVAGDLALQVNEDQRRQHDGDDAQRRAYSPGEHLHQQARQLCRHSPTAEEPDEPLVDDVAQYVYGHRISRKSRVLDMQCPVAAVWRGRACPALPSVTRYTGHSCPARARQECRAYRHARRSRSYRSTSPNMMSVLAM